ncbi:Diphosphomevalonate decarboxylase [Cystobasidium minutum MCA 4210]|uniref:Diphosphomevalonate decarboxylase n=1 Tax=Cystobasidium minutum MCA 4210 TaxID=1397322 RepID=UPI0034CDDDBB|eukprot:jgi/Rhomi1/182975/fgenesh1_pm.2_\
MSHFEATCSAPVNIAVIKYWGKRNTSLILPTNSSLSVTLSQDDLRSTTSIRASSEFKQDRLWLNGKEESAVNEGRTGACIREMRNIRKDYEAQNSSLEKIADLPIHIISSNNFPTAAGLASSASGFAALAFTLYNLYKLEDHITLSELSRIARQGSGSACRSLMGGMVAWEMGSKDDGSDSLAVTVAPQEHWPNMSALICVVSDAKKGTSSTAGMQATVQTSPLLQHRIKHVVPERMKAISEAIQKRDFETFAQITMADSNQFHAVCLDTTPPIFYMNDCSRAIIAAVNEINRAAGKIIAAYTYDAGPNAVIYAEDSNMPVIKAVISKYFYNDSADNSASLPAGFDESKVPSGFKGAVSRLIQTRVGDGPRKLSDSESLIGTDGLPKA